MSSTNSTHFSINSFLSPTLTSKQKKFNLLQSTFNSSRTSAYKTSTIFSPAKTSMRKMFVLKMHEKENSKENSKESFKKPFKTITPEAKKVLNLSKWEKAHLEYQKEDYEVILCSLKDLYKKENNVEKLDELKKIDKILTASNEINHSVFTDIKGGAGNKALEKAYLNKKQEQGSILMNSISKTCQRFNYSLFTSKMQSKIKSDLELDMNTLNSMRKDLIQLTGNEHIYRKVISDKSRLELSMKYDLSEISQKISKKRKEKEQLTQLINNFYKEFRESEIYYDSLKGAIIEEAYVLKKNSLRETKNRNFYNEIKTAQLDNSLSVVKKEEELKKIKYNKDRKSYQEKLKILEEEESYLKYIYNSMIKDQRKYFYSILKSGYDTRVEGLVWVVRRLIELGSEIDFCHFPKFLDHEQINYLISQAKYQLDEYLTTIAIKSIKNSKSRILEQENSEMTKKVSDSEGQSCTQTKTKISKPLKAKTISLSQISSTFSSLQDKYKKVLDIKTNEEIEKENKNVDTMIKNLHQDLVHKRGKSQFESKRFDLITKFLDDENMKNDYFTLVNLKKKLKEIRKKKIDEKKRMLAKTKEKEANIQKFYNAQNSLTYDLVFSALFGAKGSM